MPRSGGAVCACAMPAAATRAIVLIARNRRVGDMEPSIKRKIGSHNTLFPPWSDMIVIMRGNDNREALAVSVTEPSPQ